MDSNQSNSIRLVSPTDLLYRSFDLFKKYWKHLVPVVIIPTIVLQISAILYMLSAYYGNIIVLIISLILSLVGLVFYVAMQPAFIQLLYKHKAGSHTGIHDLIQEYKHGFVFFWPLVWLAIMQTTIFTGASIFLFIPGLILSVYLGFSVYGLVIENKKGLHAITYSYSLVKNHWFAIFGRSLFIIACTFIFGLVCGLVGSMIVAILHLDVASIFGRIIKELINLFYTATGSVISMVYYYELYSSVRHHQSRNINSKPFVGWLYFFIAMAIIFAVTGFIVLWNILP